MDTYLAESIKNEESKKVYCFAKKIYRKFAEKRLSVFFTYGINNEYTQKNAVNNMKRQIL